MCTVPPYGTQVSWSALSKDLSINHPQTLADYAAHLENMDTLFIQGALLEDKLTMAPKKAKKLFLQILLFFMRFVLGFGQFKIHLILKYCLLFRIPNSVPN